MQKLATLLRAAQFYAHASHNLTRGATFFQDHEAFGSFYEAYEEGYDKVVEQMIGLRQNPNLQAILSAATERANQLADPALFTTDVMYGVLAQFESEIQAEIDAIYADTDIGTQNLLAQLFEDSQHRGNYKIGQRLK